MFDGADTEPASADAGRKTFYLIDGHAQFFRAYHAIRSGMTSPVTGEPTNMTYGFVGILIKLLQDYSPDYLAVAIDVSGDRESFRSALYPEYKANRDQTPDDFRPQVTRCLEILEQMQIPVVGEPGVEADDVIASLVRRLEREHPDLDIRIVSRDKDLTQLVTEHTQLLDIYKEQIVTPTDIFKVEGVRPDQVVDVLALMGDTSDNVPGVPGIGPKTAAKLIIDYGSVAGVYENIEQIKGKRRENLEASRDLVDLSRRLVELKDDLDVPLTLDGAVCDPARMASDGLIALFSQLDFRSHRENLRRLAESTERQQNTEAGFGDSLWDMGGEASEPTVTIGIDGDLITNADDLATLIKRIESAGALAVAPIVDGATSLQSTLAGLAIHVGTWPPAYIPMRSPDADSHLDEAAVLEALRPVLEDVAVKTIGHDLKPLRNMLNQRGVQLAGPMADTMIASYVIDATRSSHELRVLALAMLGHTCAQSEAVLGRARARTTFAGAALEVVASWARDRAEVTWRLNDTLHADLERDSMIKLYDDVEMPLMVVLSDMEQAGVIVDPDELDRQRERLSDQIEDLRRRIVDASPHEFNPDSPKQLAAALFNAPEDEPPGLGLKVLKRGKTGPSTDQEVLEKLAADESVDSPVPELIVEHRQLTKLVNTYLVSLKEAIHPDTGRVHATFHQTVAATGRLAASDPNLQNIPIRTGVGREIRRAFVAPEGCVLLTADYSQIELRLLAHLSGDPALLQAFREGLDIHVAVAAEVYGVAPDDVTTAQRGTAKMVNFGIVYGITPYGLARRLGPGTSVESARQIIDDYKTRFARINAFLGECINAAETNGYVETILGRRRAVPQIHERHPQRRALGQRMAINTVVQGSAADLIKLAMIDLHRRLPDAYPDVRMILQIHDELVFEVPHEQVSAVKPFVVERMSAAMDLSIDLVVDAASSRAWIDTK